MCQSNGTKSVTGSTAGKALFPGAWCIGCWSRARNNTLSLLKIFHYNSRTQCLQEKKNNNKNNRYFRIAPERIERSSSLLLLFEFSKDWNKTKITKRAPFWGHHWRWEGTWCWSMPALIDNGAVREHPKRMPVSPGNRGRLLSQRVNGRGHRYASARACGQVRGPQTSVMPIVIGARDLHVAVMPFVSSDSCPRRARHPYLVMSLPCSLPPLASIEENFELIGIDRAPGFQAQQI